MNDDNKKYYLDEDGLLFYTQKLKALLDQKTDVETTTEIQGLITALQNSKVDKVTGKGLSTNDLTNELKATYDAKQDALTAGDNIDITNGVISATDTIYDDTEVRSDISALQSGKVDKVQGKGLSTEDYTTAEKSKLENIEAGAEVNIIETVKVNNTSLTPDANRAVNVSVPTAVSQLTNDSDYQTGTEVDAAITEAIAGVTQIRFEIVQELPQVGENGVIYLVLYGQGPQGNIYQEWIWLSSSQSYETLGRTNQIGLTNYVQFSDLIAISNQDIETIVGRVFPSNNNNNANNGNSESNDEEESDRE